MKHLRVFLALSWLCGAVCAQVDVDLAPSREGAVFLPGEPVEMAVRFANFTGGPLTLGAEPGWLQFTVEGLGNRVVTKLSDPSESGEFTLEQATRGTLRWNLTPLFNLEDPGTYRVVATVHLPDGEVRSTPPATFEIVTGVPLHEPREVGVKMPDGSIERRKFILQQVNFFKQLQLYLRITDPSESRTLSIINLGPTYSFDRPQWTVDRETRFHVLHRSSSHLYAYQVFRGDGTLLVRQLWTGERPELKILNEAGEVGVRGGQRRPDRSDVPSPPATNSVSALPAATPTGAPAVPSTGSTKNDAPVPPP